MNIGLQGAVKASAILIIYYTITNTAIKICYIWNERKNLEVLFYIDDTELEHIL